MPRKIARLLALLLPFTAALAAPALAGPREDTLAGISRCAAIADDRGFLDCIYGAAQPLRTSLGLPPASIAQQRLVPPAIGLHPVGQNLTGQPALALTASAPPPPRHSGFLGGLFGGDTPALHMASYTFDKHGMFTVTLSDGEIWQQTGSDIAYAHWRAPAANYTVTLAEGGYGGDQMQVGGEPGTYVVHRLR